MNFFVEQKNQWLLKLVLLIGAVYTIYKFMVFSLYEVKKDFGRRHEDNAKAMSDLKVLLTALLKKKLTGSGQE